VLTAVNSSTKSVKRSPNRPCLHNKYLCIFVP